MCFSIANIITAVTTRPGTRAFGAVAIMIVTIAVRRTVRVAPQVVVSIIHMVGLLAAGQRQKQSNYPLASGH